jgi:hypothetical protein
MVRKGALGQVWRAEHTHGTSVSVLSACSALQHTATRLYSVCFALHRFRVQGLGLQRIAKTLRFSIYGHLRFRIQGLGFTADRKDVGFQDSGLRV